MEVVAVLRMLDRQVLNYLLPIAMCENVSRLWIIRPLPYHLAPLPKTTYVEIRGNSRWSQFQRLHRKAVELGNRDEVGAFVSFNAVPYGMLAQRAARQCGKPVHVGFVGTDWHRHATNWYGPLINRRLCDADLVTTTGSSMRDDLIARGYPADRVAELPHAIDLDEFAPHSDPLDQCGAADTSAWDKAWGRSFYEDLSANAATESEFSGSFFQANANHGGVLETPSSFRASQYGSESSAGRTHSDPCPYDAVFVGALIHRKRVDLLLAAWQTVVCAKPDARLLIVGDGPLRGELEYQARASGLDRNVEFVGRQTELAEFYRSAKTVVIPSDGEGFPFALVEGLCCGAVPVATRVGTIADSIQDGHNGALVPPGNADALASALLRILDDPAEFDRLRRTILADREQYSFQHCSQLWTTWLDQMHTRKTAQAG